MEEKREKYISCLLLELFFLRSDSKIKFKNQDLQADITFKNKIRRFANLTIIASSLVITKNFYRTVNNRTLYSSFVFGFMYYSYHSILFFALNISIFGIKYRNTALENQYEILENAIYLNQFKDKFGDAYPKDFKLRESDTIKTSEVSLDSQDSERMDSDMVNKENNSVKGFGSGFNEQIEKRPDENYISDPSQDFFFSEKNFKPANKSQDFDGSTSEEASKNKATPKPVRRTFIKYQQNPDSSS